MLTMCGGLVLAVVALVVGFFVVGSVLDVVARWNGRRVARADARRSATAQLRPEAPLTAAELKRHVPPALQALGASVQYDGRTFERPVLARAAVLATYRQLGSFINEYDNEMTTLRYQADVIGWFGPRGLELVERLNDFDRLAYGAISGQFVVLLDGSRRQHAMLCQRGSAGAVRSAERR